MDLDNIINNVTDQAKDLAEKNQMISNLNNIPLENQQQSGFVDLISTNDLSINNISIKCVSDAYVVRDDNVFLQQAYQSILGRSIDEQGKANYTKELHRGVPRAFILIQLQRSAEAIKHREDTKNHLIRGLGFLGFIQKITRICERLKLNKISFGINYTVKKWEIKNIVGWNKIYEVLDDMNKSNKKQLQQIQSVLQSKSQYDANIKDKLVSQIGQAQSLAYNANEGYQLLHHKINYHQQALERLIKDLESGVKNIQQTAIDAHQQDKLDAYYVAFEDFNRGSRDEIRDKQAPYLERISLLLHTHLHLKDLPVMDVGCGRGEWIALLQEQNIQAIGIDMNPVMIDECIQGGLQAQHMDAVAYLKMQPDNSHAAVTGFHIIEHLPFEVLFDLFAEAYRVLAPKGMIIFETPNPENLLVGSHTFYHDFTHRNPITPSAIEFLAKYQNFEQIELLRLHPYPEEARVIGSDPLTERVNGHLTGPQDFTLIAQKPELKIS